MAIHVGDVGVTFELSVVNESGGAASLAGATTLQLIFTKPDGTTVTKTATNPSTNKISWTTTLAADIPTAGQWSVKARVVTPTTDKTSDSAFFAVLP